MSKRFSRELVLGLILAVFIQITGLPALHAADAQDVATITVRNGQSVLVDGKPATNGGPVVTGAQIETGSGAEATINIPTLGSVRVFQNTDTTVAFGPNGINVNVRRGCVSVFNNDGVRSLLTKSDGQTEASTGTEAGEINNCDRDPGGGGGGGGGGGIGTWGLIGLLAEAGGIVGIIILAKRAQDASPMTP